MTDPNTITVFSPANEPFEMSHANARDLTSHAGWTYSPQGAAPAAEPEAAEPEDTTDASTADEGSDEVSDEAEEGTEDGTEDGGDTGEEEAGDEGEEEVASDDAVLFTTEEQFEGMERDEIVAYLSANFPDYHPHHKTGVEKLIAKAIELATA